MARGLKEVNRDLIFRTGKGMLNLIKSYRVKSHKVVPVKSLASIISRQVDGEKGKANW
jgi:hypothetical protein